MTYQTNTRNPFDGPAATNIGTFDITWPSISRVVWVLLGSCITADSQCTNIWISARKLECGQIRLLWLWHTGTHYVRHLFKIAPLRSNKSQHLLDFNFHLLRQPSSDYWTLPYLTAILLTYPICPHMLTLLLRQTPTMVCAWHYSVQCIS